MNKTTVTPQPVSFDHVRSKDGNSKFEDFLVSLPDKDRAKFQTVTENIMEKGMIVALKMEWVKKIEDDLYEIRSDFGNNRQRALFFKKGNNEFIITHGFTKKTKKTPEKEKRLARQIRKDYKDGKYS